MVGLIWVFRNERQERYEFRLDGALGSMLFVASEYTSDVYRYWKELAAAGLELPLSGREEMERLAPKVKPPQFESLAVALRAVELVAKKDDLRIFTSIRSVFDIADHQRNRFWTQNVEAGATAVVEWRNGRMSAERATKWAEDVASGR